MFQSVSSKYSVLGYYSQDVEHYFLVLKYQKVTEIPIYPTSYVGEAGFSIDQE